MNKFCIDKEYVDMRLDKFVRKYSKLQSLSQIFSLIRKGKLKINGKKAKENYRFKLNDVLTFSDDFEMEIKKFEKIKTFNLKDLIVFEDEDIFIINKPSNLAMHKGNNHEYGLAEISKSYFNNANINFANRLDKETQGLVIGCKNLQFLRKINEEIRNKKVEKKYIAMVKNTNLKLNDSFVVNKKIEVCEDGIKISNNGKEAISEFKVIKILDDKAILDVNLITGRKHQIRVHLKSINMPIIGDVKYGKKADKMYLKCYYLKFLNYEISIEKSF